jgi:hypothetical protein
MNPKAVPQAGLKGKFGLSLALVVVGLMSVVLTGSAVAAPITKGGQVHACYRVKGKAKGAMRVVPVNKKCRRGEKKLAWSVAGPAGSAGQNGAPGADGTNGSNGATGPQGSTNEAALQAKIAGLTVKVEGLEGILGTVTNVELTEAIGTVPVVGSLCSQTSAVTSQANLLRGTIGGLDLDPALKLIGLLKIPTLPTELPAFAC